MSPTQAGYSGTPLIQKLGIKPNMKLLLLDAPDGYMDWLQTDMPLQLAGKGEVADLVHLFAVDQAAFVKGMSKALAHAQQNKHCITWVSWYKKSSGLASDLTEDTIRAYAIAKGLVDVKVCAVSHQWSGLKLLVPLALR